MLFDVYQALIGIDDLLEMYGLIGDAGKGGTGVEVLEVLFEFRFRAVGSEVGRSEDATGEGAANG